MYPLWATASRTPQKRWSTCEYRRQVGNAHPAHQLVTTRQSLGAMPILIMWSALHAWQACSPVHYQCTLHVALICDHHAERLPSSATTVESIVAFERIRTQSCTTKVSFVCRGGDSCGSAQAGMPELEAAVWAHEEHLQ